METIVIDEEPLNSRSKPNQSIKLTYDRTVARNYKPINNFASIYDENKLFAEFLLKCLDLELSDGMLRIINKSLVKTYEETDKVYRNSSNFSRVLVKALSRLEKDPEHKFSHVKDMVETLKLHIPKKRAQLVTLETNLKKNGIHTSKATRKPIVIDSDDESSVIETISLDDEEVLHKNTPHKDEEKENLSSQSLSQPHSSQPVNLLEPQIAIQVPNSETQRSMEIVPENDPEIKKKIQSLEAEIKILKHKIEECEQAEVTDDSIYSPYIKCDSYKRKLVNLYKELCKLVGDEPVKRRTVRFQVLEGHPPGPMKRLEQFINNNIGENGIPLFPDFSDVVQCVMAANVEEKLGWNKKMVMKEANSLFTQCGRALQKQRQNREYREQILSRITDEGDLDHDPAENDPVWLAKLEENRRIAMRRENNMFERFSMLQDLPSHILRPGPSTEIDQEQNNNKEISKDSESEDSNFEPPVIFISSQEVVNDKNLDTNENINTDKHSLGEGKCEVKVKQEPMDIVEMLEKLGDNFTSTVIDIEDPHLVIEISSDDEYGYMDIED